MEEANLITNQEATVSKRNKYIGLVIVLMVLLLLSMGLYYVATSDMLWYRFGGVKQPSAVSMESQVIKPNFSYRVKSIATDTIVLEGLKGDFTLPIENMSVRAYAGLTKNAPAMILTDLKVGDSLNMEFVSGKSADLFVSQL